MKVYKPFAVFGASGSGKSTLLSIIRRVCPEASVHKKFTTRGQRPGESLENLEDLEHVEAINPDLCEEIYRKFSNYYGIRKELLRIAHANREMHFMIIRDIQAIRRLKSKYPELAVIYIHSDPHDIEDAVQAREGLDKQERLRRIHDDYIDYVNNVTLFDHVVLNFWDIENAVKQLRHLIAHYQHAAAQSLVV